MAVKIGCCISIDWYDTLEKLGYDSIALAGVDVASWSEAAFAQALAKVRSGRLQTISLNSFCPSTLRLTGKGVDMARIRDYTECVCARASKLGVRYIGVGAPGSRNIELGSTAEAARGELKGTIAAICEIAARYGLDILLESVCSVECNLLTTTREALCLIRELRIPNLHLVYDVYHEYTERQPLSVIAEAGDEIRVVHIAENRGNTRCYLDEAHLAEYRRYRDALKAIGYQGEWNLEAMCGDPADELPKSYRILKCLQEETDGHEGD